MPTQQLSPHFSLQEMTYSQTGARMGLDNTPTTEAYAGLERLTATLERVRRILGDKPILITSGYRSEAVNQAVGGSPTSAHMSGLAADFICPEYGDPLDICLRLEANMEELQIDQLIWEYGDWVHFALVAKPAEPRHECLTINANGTSTGFPGSTALEGADV